MIDINKLSKLLILTESTHDGECLNSIRAANKILSENGLRWDNILLNYSSKSEMLDQIKKVERLSAQIQDLNNEICDLKKRGSPTIEEKINILMLNNRSGFIESLNCWLKEKHFLTPKQKEKLDEIYDAGGY